MAGIADATDTMMKMFLEVWQPTGYEVVFANEVKEGEDPAPALKNEPWAGVEIVNRSRRYRSLAHSQGGVVRCEASMNVTLFTPADRSGMADINNLADDIVRFFTGARRDGVNFYDIFPNELGVKGRWNMFQINMSCYYFNDGRI